MVKVKIRNNEPFDKALSRFNQLVLKSGILKEARDKSRFKKPSEIKAEKIKEKQRRIYFERKIKSQ